MADKMTFLYCWLKAEFDAFKNEERGAVDLVVIVVLIAIAVGLAILFKDQIGGILSRLFGEIDSATTGLTE